MHVGFRKHAGVARGEDPLAEFAVQACFAVGEFGFAGKIGQVLRIGFQVVEFFVGFRGGQQERVGSGDAAELAPDCGGLGIGAVLENGAVGGVVADEEIAAVGDGARDFNLFVDAVAGGEREFAGLGLLRPEEGGALHVGGRGKIGEGKNGGGKVYEADEAGGVGAWFEFWGSDEEGDAEAGFVEEPFAAGESGAMVGEEEDYGVGGVSVRFQFGKDFAGAGVHESDLCV